MLGREAWEGGRGLHAPVREAAAAAQAPGHGRLPRGDLRLRLRPHLLRPARRHLGCDEVAAVHHERDVRHLPVVGEERSNLVAGLPEERSREPTSVSVRWSEVEMRWVRRGGTGREGGMEGIGEKWGGAQARRARRVSAEAIDLQGEIASRDARGVDLVGRGAL